MPNHCSNSLTVIGPKDDLESFVKAHYSAQTKWETGEPYEEKIPLNFEASVPYPPLEERGPYGELNNQSGKITGWDWQVNNWGVKWGAYGFSDDYNPIDFISKLKGEPDNQWKIVYNFDTAWGPPFDWIVKASQKYPSLLFFLTYEEPNMDFCGIFIVKDGEVCFESDEDYSTLMKCPPDGLELSDPDSYFEKLNQAGMMVSEELQQRGWERVREILKNSEKPLDNPSSNC